jgi:hypothetical protein
MTAALVLLVLLDVVLLYALLTRDVDDPADVGDATAGGPSAVRESSRDSTPRRPASTGADPGLGRLVLDPAPLVAAPFRPVAIRGTWRSAPTTRSRAAVHVEVRRAGGWSAFPLPAVVKASGRFTAYAALGAQGRYRVRVVGAGGKPVSTPVVVTVG